MAKCVKCGKSGLFLKTNVEGMCPECQKQILTSLRNALSPEQKNVMFLEEKIQQLNNQIQNLDFAIEAKNQQIQGLDINFQRKKEDTDRQIQQLYSNFQKKKEETDREIQRLNVELQHKKLEIVETEEAALLQSFGVYKPKYDFVNSEAYKDMLDVIRTSQKEMIKADTATTGFTNWTVDGSAAKGKTMVKNMQKLLLRAFNGECDETINKVRYSNFDASVKRITSSKDAISKLGSMMGVAITERYFKLKIDELTLAFEYQQMKQKEKEEQQALKAQMREEAKLIKEIEAARKNVAKEQNHYFNALEKVNKQLAENPTNAELLAKKAEIEKGLDETEKAMKDIDYREANKRAGYVYIISNIGAFGENVYKIGMTRRLVPQERIDELGDASVPFNFDVHAMIFSKDAPGLENALHHAFESRRLNKVNARREFFNVTLDEIKAVVRKHYDSTAEFIDLPEAEQYRLSLKM